MDEPGFTHLSDCRVAIVGLGLMGGSLALALRDRCREIVGVDTDPDTLTLARQRAIIDRAAELDAALDCDLLVLACPVRAILAWLDRLAQSEIGNRRSTIVVDLGSTKSDIVAAMEALPPGFDPIGGHPLCGKESSGLEAADAGLFHGAVFVLSPLSRTSSGALSLANELVAAIGAHPLMLEAAQHDRLVAVSSHLPYLLACALVGAAERQGDAAIWRVVASGFRDTSRLAASNVTVMSDILRTNRARVIDALAAARGELDRLASLITSDDEEALREALDVLRRRRRQLFGASSGAVEETELQDALIDLWPGA